MNPLVKASFPIGAEKRQGAGGPAAGEGRAWQREMERAQAAAWFQGPVARDRGSRATGEQQLPPASAPAETVARQAQEPVAQATTREQAVPGAGEHRAAQKPAGAAGEAASPAPSDGGSSAAGTRANVRQGSASVFAHGRVPTLPAAGETVESSHASVSPSPAAMPLRPQRGVASLALPEPESIAPAATAERADAQPAVRVYVEDGADGLSVWLGMDGDPSASAARAAAVLAELRRHLGASSQRLAAVVCNGKLLYGDAKPPVSFPPTQEQEP